MAKALMRAGEGSRSARTKHSIARAEVSTNSAYGRASWEYQTNSGLTATSAPASNAARRPANSRPIAHATGTVAIPASAEGSRRATSPVPSTRESAHAIRYHSGGEFSLWTIARSVAHRLRCRTWTGANASSYQKLCRSSVDRRSAGARSTRAARAPHPARLDLAGNAVAVALEPAGLRTGTVLLLRPGRSSRSGTGAGLRDWAAGTSRCARRGGRERPLRSSPDTAALVV